ncbi:hypothetical protein JOC34_000848 [Virgibacillus halotolerans]|uniref:HNH endonuclease n=1 Tax=Virgibacillus halotolerans TaxID=1071053 RepID=UPI001960030D|nr:HNH endonuclease [Virgibacillus halotolerans]MBM7598491.1 hypothetical protein [Virgibacillus halotolerans]
MSTEKFRDDLIEVEDGLELYPIPGFSNYYCDLENGRVWNNKKQFWITANPNSLLYCYATIYDEFGEPVRISIHNLVMMARTGKDKSIWRKQGLEVHHIDNDTTNNSVFNLALTTREQQYQCPITKQTLANRSKKRLTKDDVIAIKTDWLEWEGTKGNFYNLWASKLEVHTRSIQNIIIGFSYKDVEVG